MHTTPNLGAYLPIGTAALVIVGHLLAARDRRRKAEVSTEKLTEISVNVDGRLDAALGEIAELREALGVAKRSPAEPAHE